MLFLLVFDLTMAVIMLLFGLWFYRSNGHAAQYLSGYRPKSEAQRASIDEKALCKHYGRYLMLMSLPFLLGILVDVFFVGIGCLLAWAIWMMQFVVLLIARYKTER